jgi:hypothetical protein
VKTHTKKQIELTVFLALLVMLCAAVGSISGSSLGHLLAFVSAMFFGCAAVESVAPFGEDTNLLSDLGYGALRLLVFILVIGLAFAAASDLLHSQNESDKAALAYVVILPMAAALGSGWGFVLRRHQKRREDKQHLPPGKVPAIDRTKML